MIRSRTAITERMILTALVTVRIVSAAFWPLLTSWIAVLIGFGLPFGPGGRIASWIEARSLALSGWTTTASGSGFEPWSWGILSIFFCAAFASFVVASGYM